LSNAWQEPDDGIWEVRGGRRHFTHSKIMAWVAFDRVIRMIQEQGAGGDEGQKMLPHLSALRERIHGEVCERGFNPRVGAFTQYYGSTELDASVLVMTHFGFLPGSDPRVQGTVAAIEKNLIREGFVLRYGTEHGTDGLPGSEGAFKRFGFCPRGTIGVWEDLAAGARRHGATLGDGASPGQPPPEGSPLVQMAYRPRASASQRSTVSASAAWCRPSVPFRATGSRVRAPALNADRMLVRRSSTTL